MADTYCVYEHVFPNHKKYIGISSNLKTRWNNGYGYKTQKKVWNAIQKYGWDNITHKVIVEGLTKEQAENIEKYLIGELDTIRNGYNTTVGGENVTSTYLDSYILSMIRKERQEPNENKATIQFSDGALILCEMVFNDRYDLNASEMWNNAANAICKKHGFLSPSDRLDCFRFWWYLAQYYMLWLKMQIGEDVSNWTEQQYEDRYRGVIE